SPSCIPCWSKAGSSVQTPCIRKRNGVLGSMPMMAIIWRSPKRTSQACCKISSIFLPTRTSMGENGSITEKYTKAMGEWRVREIWTSTQMNEWFEGEWAGIAQIFKIRRYVKKGEQEHEEIVYGFTNLPRK